MVKKSEGRVAIDTSFEIGRYLFSPEKNVFRAVLGKKFISYGDLARWKENSLSVARDSGVLSNEVLSVLEDKVVCVVYEGAVRRKKRRFAERMYQLMNGDKGLYVYNEDMYRFWPFRYSEMANQLHMDRQIIGHFGFDFLGKESDRLQARIAVAAMVSERAKSSWLWWGRKILNSSDGYVRSVKKRVFSKQKDSGVLVTSS